MTNAKRYAIFGTTFIALLLGAAWRPTAAQAPAAAAASVERRASGPGADEVLRALLTEVKGLRAAMEQMGAGSTQAQVLIGRLQLQESRVNSMIRRLDTVRDTQASARREYDQLRGAVQMFGKDDALGGAHDEDGEGVLARMKAQVATAKANVDRLTAEQAQLTADIATEQQRWVAINQRLDDLERTLAKR